MHAAIVNGGPSGSWPSVGMCPGVMWQTRTIARSPISPSAINGACPCEPRIAVEQIDRDQPIARLDFLHELPLRGDVGGERLFGDDMLFRTQCQRNLLGLSVGQRKKAHHVDGFVRKDAARLRQNAPELFADPAVNPGEGLTAGLGG